MVMSRGDRIEKLVLAEIAVAVAVTRECLDNDKFNGYTRPPKIFNLNY